MDCMKQEESAMLLAGYGDPSRFPISSDFPRPLALMKSFATRGASQTATDAVQVCFHLDPFLGSCLITCYIAACQVLHNYFFNHGRKNKQMFGTMNKWNLRKVVCCFHSAEIKKMWTTCGEPA